MRRKIRELGEILRIGKDGYGRVWECCRTAFAFRMQNVPFYLNK